MYQIKNKEAAIKIIENQINFYETVKSNTLLSEEMVEGKESLKNRILLKNINDFDKYYTNIEYWIDKEGLIKSKANPLLNRSPTAIINSNVHHRCLGIYGSKSYVYLNDGNFNLSKDIFLYEIDKKSYRSSFKIKFLDVNYDFFTSNEMQNIIADFAFNKNRYNVKDKNVINMPEVFRNYLLFK